MRNKLSIRQLFIDTLGFIGNNIPLLGVLTIFSFIGSYFGKNFGVYSNRLAFLVYALYIYFFYFFFVSLYFAQKPLITKEKFVDSVIKLICIFAFSFFVLLCGHFAIGFLRYCSRYLIGFPDIYSFLRETYIFLALNPYAKILIYAGIIVLLTFSFFIPGFAWVSTVNNKDNSILTAFDKVRGNYIKVVIVCLLIFCLFPLLISIIGLNSSIWLLSIFHALLTIFQLVAYLQLYEFFYKE